jgi:hypothetical protein
MWIVLATSLLLAAPEDRITTLAGEELSGQLVAITADHVTVNFAGAEKRFASGDLLSLQPIAPTKVENKAQPLVWIELIDGSQLLAASYTVAAGNARASLVGGESVEIPTRSIRAVRLKEHDSDVARTSQLPRQWQEALATKSAGDVIVIRKLTPADAPADKQTAALDQLEGVLGEITADKVNFTFDGNSIPVDRAKVEGVVYFHPSGRELPDPLCRLDDDAGSKWNLKSLSLAGEELEAVSVSGVKIKLPISRLAALDYSAGKIVYLSDLEPQTAEWTNLFGQTPASKGLARLYAPRRDKSFDGGPITAGDRSFSKGLALRSRTLVEYRLDAKFNKLLALAAIDPKTTGGDVRLVISLDGKPLGEHKVTGRDAGPTSIEHDIRGGRKLSILVDFGEGLDIADRLHLANARVTK